MLESASEVFSLLSYMESLTLSCRSFQFAGTFFLSFLSVYLKTSYEKIKKIKKRQTGSSSFR